MKDAYNKSKDENKQNSNQRRSCAFYEELGQVLSARNVVKLTEVYEVSRLKRSLNHPLNITLIMTQLMTFKKKISGEQIEPKKKKT